MCIWQHGPIWAFCLILALSFQGKAQDHFSLSAQDKLELAILAGDQTALVEAQATRHLQERPKSAFSHYLVSEFYIHRFLLDEKKPINLIKARDLAEQAIALEPKSQFGYLATAHILALAGDFQKAKALLERFKIQDSTFHFRVEFALIRLSKKRIKEGILNYQELAKTGPLASNMILPHLAYLITSNLELQEAANLLKKLAKEYPTNQQIQKSLVQTLFKLESFDEALAQLNYLQKNNLQDTELSIYHAFLISERFSKHTKAAEELNKILNDVTLSEKLRTIALSYLGVLALKENQVKAALDWFTQALLLPHPSVEQISFVMAHLVKSKQYEGLVRLIDRLADEMPAKAPLFALQGEILSVELNRKKEALHAFQKATLLDPENSSYINALGVLHFELGELKEALATFEDALLIDSKNFAAHYNKACVLSAMGNYQDASWHLKEAFRINPTLGPQMNDLERTTLIRMPQSSQPK